MHNLEKDYNRHLSVIKKLHHDVLTGKVHSNEINHYHNKLNDFAYMAGDKNTRNHYKNLVAYHHNQVKKLKRNIALNRLGEARHLSHDIHPHDEVYLIQHYNSKNKLKEQRLMNRYYDIYEKGYVGHKMKNENSYFNESINYDHYGDPHEINKADDMLSHTHKLLSNILSKYGGSKYPQKRFQELTAHLDNSHHHFRNNDLSGHLERSHHMLINAKDNVMKMHPNAFHEDDHEYYSGLDPLNFVKYHVNEKDKFFRQDRNRRRMRRNI